MHFPAIWGFIFQKFFHRCLTVSGNNKETQSLGKNGCREKCFDKSLLIQVTWVQKPSLPSLAGFIKTLKARLVLAGFDRFVVKAAKRELAGSLAGSGMEQPSLPSLAGFIKTDKKIKFC